MKKIAILTLVAIIASPVFVVAQEQNTTQKAFEEGFVLGQLYIKGHTDRDSAIRYNEIVKDYNNLLNETYGTEAVDHLLPLLQIPAQSDKESESSSVSYAAPIILLGPPIIQGIWGAIFSYEFK